MTVLARFDLFGVDDCPVAQGVALALVHRRSFFRWEPRHGPTQLRITDAEGEGVLLRDPAGMIEWIEDLLPDATLTSRSAGGQALLRGAARLPARVAAVTAARHARDLDLAQHFLHEALQPLEAEAGGRRVSALDFLIAPVLWRIDLLDRAFGAHLLAGLPGLEARIGWFLGLPRSGRVLNAAAQERYLAAVSAAGGVLAAGGHRCDWSRAFGQAAPPRDRPLWRRRAATAELRPE